MSGDPRDPFRVLTAAERANTRFAIAASQGRNEAWVYRELGDVPYRNSVMGFVGQVIAQYPATETGD